MTVSQIFSGPSYMDSVLLFNVVPEVATCDKKDWGLGKDYKEKERTKFLTEYHIVLCPNAYYYIGHISCLFVLHQRLTTDELNATFFRSWEEVIRGTNTELKFKQALVYCSAFFGIYHCGSYVPANRVPLSIEEPEEGWKFERIDAISADEIAERSLKLLRGGTALNFDTWRQALRICTSSMKIDRSELRNRCARATEGFGAPPGCSGRFEDLQPDFTLGELFNGYVKDRSTIRSIQQSNCDVSRTFESYGVDKLATIFQRYKVFFLALKKANKANCKIINRISKRSKTLHVPMPSNPLNSVCVRPIDIDRDARWLNSATISAKLRALNSCKLAMVEQNGFRYNIRNGRIWAKDHIRPPMEAATVNFNILLDDLRASLGAKFAGKVIYIPSGIEYGLPISDLQMAGNIPFGTRFTVPTSQSLAVGIHWKPGYTEALHPDLSGKCDDGVCVSWCTQFKHKSFCHSGDMTMYDYNLGGTEYILAEGRSGEIDESISLRASNRVGYAGYFLNIIIGTVDDITQKYMMHPNNRIASFQYDALKRTCDIGYLTRNSEKTTFILTPGASSQGRVNKTTDMTTQKASNNHAKHVLKHGLTLNSFLELLGARIVHVKDETVDIDLGLDKISKDLLNIFYC